MCGKKDYMIGKKVIVRTDRAGVFFGELVEKNGTDAKMKNVRKLFYWNGAAAIEQLAMEGTKRPNDCKFTVVVPEMEITQVIQIIPCTAESIANLEGVKVWRI
jgi:FMN-dependent NADH-azoreductase